MSRVESRVTSRIVVSPEPPCPCSFATALIVTMNDRLDIVDGDVSIQDGRIAAIGRESPRDARPKPSTRAAGIILPGLIQTHIHLCQTLFRGYADDRPLMDWLRQRVWPMEAAHTPSTLRTAARLATTELLTTGTTAVLTMETVHDTDAVLEAVAESGLRATVGKCMMDSSREAPDRLQEPTRTSIDESLSLRKRWHGAATDTFTRHLRPGLRSPARASCWKQWRAFPRISRRWCTRMRRNHVRRLRSFANSRAG